MATADEKEIRIEIKSDSAKAVADIRKLTGTITKLQAKMESTGKISQKNLNQTSRSVMSLTAHLTKLAAIYGTFHTLVGAVVTTAEFEQAVKRLGVVSGAAAMELDALHDKALELGESTVFSASQVADAMNEMALGGLSASDQLKGVGDILNLAAVGMIDMAEASNIAVVAMKSYGLTASKLGDITDIIAKGSTNSATTITELGQALAKVGTVAKAYNVSLEETVASLGILADAGRRGAEAGTQLKIVMSRLAGNKEAKKYIDDLGVSMYDANHQILPFNKQLEIIDRALKKLPPDIRAIKMSEIFGEEGKASAIALMEHLDMFQLKLEDLKRAMADDFAEAAAKDMMDTLMGSYKELMSALEGLAIQLGEHLIPFLTKTADEYTKMVKDLDPQDIKDIADEIKFAVTIFKQFVNVVLSVSHALLRVLETNDKLITSIGALVIAFKAFTFVANMNPIVRGFTLGLGLLTVAVDGYEKKVKELTKTERAMQAELKKSAKAWDELLLTLEEAYSSSSDGELALGAQQREDMLEILGKQYAQLQDIIVSYEKEAKTNSIVAEQLREAIKRREDLVTVINLVADASSKAEKAAKDETDAWLENGKLTEKKEKNLAKLEKTYASLSTNAQVSLDKLYAKESRLIVDLKKLALEKEQIERKYYNERLSLEDEFADRFKALRATYAQEHMTAWQKNQEARKKLLREEERAFREMYSGNLEKADEYFRNMLAMTDKLTIGSLGADGKILASAEAVKKEKLRLTETIYAAEMYIIKQKEIKELQAHKLQVDMKIVELKMMKLQFDTVKQYFNTILSKSKEISDNPVQLTDAKTADYLKEYDSLLKTLKKDAAKVTLDLKTKQSELELQDLQRQINETHASVQVGLDTSSTVTEMRIIRNKFVEVPVDLPVELNEEYLDRQLENKQKEIATRKAYLPVKADTKDMVKDTEKEAVKIKKIEPQTAPVVADISNAVEVVEIYKNWVATVAPVLEVVADVSPVVSAVNSVIAWINTQTATIDVYANYHNANGGFIPKYAGGGRVFSGHGKVPGYDPTDSDKVSAMLTGGEYVIKREAVDLYGQGLLNAINQMQYIKPQGYASGGAVGGSSDVSEPLQPINLNIGGKEFAMFSDAEVGKALQRYLRNTGGR